MTALEILVKARDMIEARWAQGDEDGVLPQHECVCAWTAVVEAHNGKDAARDTQGALAFVRAAAGVRTRLGLVAWNDARGRTKAEVVAVFDQTISLARRFVRVSSAG